MHSGSHLDVFDFSKPRPRVRSNPTGSVMDGARHDHLRRNSSSRLFPPSNRSGSFGNYQQISNTRVGGIQEDESVADFGSPDRTAVLPDEACPPPPELMPGDVEIHNSPTYVTTCC